MCEFASIYYEDWSLSYKNHCDSPQLRRFFTYTNDLSFTSNKPEIG